MLALFGSLLKMSTKLKTKRPTVKADPLIPHPGKNLGWRIVDQLCA
jgi:hypothetical protein